MQSTQDPLAAIEAELAKQDAEWRDAQEQLRAAGDDVELLVQESTLEPLTQHFPDPAEGQIPTAFTRA